MYRKLNPCCVWMWALIAGVSLPGSVSTYGDEKVTFDDHIKPLLTQRCASCHNPNDKSGDLDVTNFTALMLGGGSGTVIELGEPSSSYLYKLIIHEESPEMPPDADKLPEAEIELVRKWIEGGALENKSSKAAPKKKKVAAVSGDATVRPESIPLPCRLNLDVAAVPQRSPAVMAMATSPWAPLVAIGTPFQVLLFDTQTQQLQGVLPFPEGHIFSLRFSRNGGVLVAGGGRAAANGVVVAWDIQTGERVVEISGLTDAVLASDISSDHTRIAAGTTDRMVRIFDTGTGKQIHEIKKHTDWIQAIEFSPDGVLLATGDRSGGVLVWEAKTGREYLDLRGHQGPITGVSWRVDSNVLSSASQDGTIRMWEMENGGQIANWGAHGGGVTAIQFTRDSRIVSGGRDNQAKIFNQSGNQEKAYPCSHIVTSVRVCDETNRLIACDLHGQIKMRDVATDAELGPIDLVIPHLDVRLAQAAARLESVQKQNQEFSQRLASLQATRVQRETELATMEAQQKEWTELQAKLSQQFQQSVMEVDGLQAQHATAEDLVNRLGPGVSNMTQAIEAVQRALGTMESPQLETSLKQLTELKQSNEVQLSTQMALVEQLPSKIAEIRMMIAELEQRQKTTAESLVALEPKLAMGKSGLEEVRMQVEAANGELQSHQPFLEAEVLAHSELQQAVEFSQRETEILTQIANHNQAFEKTAERLDTQQGAEAELLKEIGQLTSQITAQTDQIAGWQARHAESKQLEMQLAKEITETQQRAVASSAMQGTLQDILVKLATSAEALEHALKIRPDDEEIKQAHEQSQVLIQRRTELLQTEISQLQAWEMRIEECRALVVQQQAQQVELTASIEQANAEIVKVEMALSPLQVKHTELQTAIVGIEAELTQLEASIQSARNQLMLLRGVLVASDDSPSPEEGQP